MKLTNYFLNTVCSHFKKWDKLLPSLQHTCRFIRDRDHDAENKAENRKQMQGDIFTIWRETFISTYIKVQVIVYIYYV